MTPAGGTYNKYRQEKQKRCLGCAVPGVGYAYSVASHGQVSGHRLWTGLFSLITVQSHRPVRLKHTHGS